MQQPLAPTVPLPPPPWMRAPRAAREAAVDAMARTPRQGPSRAAREAAVATRTRPPEPEPEPRPRPGPYHAAGGRAAREANVSTVARPPEPEPRPRPGPYHAVDDRTTREDVATMERTPEPGPYYAPEGRATREASVATMPMSPEPRPWPYPYYASERPVRRTSALASCLVAAAFLLLAGGGAATALFLLFRPRPPDIAVAAVRLPSFAAANGTVAFIFEQMASVRNPNRAPLAHFDSSLRVAYAGGEVGSVYIPAGLIDGGRSKDMSASFAVPAFAAATPPPLEVASSAAQQPAAAAAVMEVDSLLVVKGKVTVLRVLTHRVQAAKVCRVGVSPVDGRVLGFRC